MTPAGSTPLRALLQARSDEIKAIVARHHGRSVAVVGSVARGDERAGSDIDFLVEMDRLVAVRALAELIADV